VDAQSGSLLPDSMKFQIEYLDVVILRSCQLRCDGCCTFSHHDEINGLEEAEDYEDQIAFWAKHLNPKRINIFGGEPLLHPRFINWFRLITKYFNDQSLIWVNTNGYLINRLLPHIDELFVDNDTKLCLAVTKHTKDEPYGSLVDSSFKMLLESIKTRIASKNQTEYFWERVPNWESEFKRFYNLVSPSQPEIFSHGFASFCDQFNDNFVPHYQGYGQLLKPWHRYDDDLGMHQNHEVCHIKNYVQLYQGNLYKCPPRAVLNQTLNTFNLQNDKDWVNYYNNYKPLEPTDNLNAIEKWLDAQKKPEKTCNMCGFMHSHEYHSKTQHLPKKMFKLKVS
jgi:pyruvate-formate lyase-activating enzyme